MTNFDEREKALLNTDRGTMAALRAIAEERQNQVNKSFTRESDDKFSHEELASAAIAMVVAGSCKNSSPGVLNSNGFLDHHDFWPDFWSTRPIDKVDSYRDGLVKAAAFLVAEIERLERSELEKFSHLIA